MLCCDELQSPDMCGGGGGGKTLNPRPCAALGSSGRNPQRGLGIRV